MATVIPLKSPGCALVRSIEYCPAGLRVILLSTGTPQGCVISPALFALLSPIAVLPRSSVEFDPS